MTYFTLTVRFSDGHTVDLDERYDAQFRAERAATNYIRDFSDPCQLGVCVKYVSVHEHGADYDVATGIYSGREVVTFDPINT